MLCCYASFPCHACQLFCKQGSPGHNSYMRIYYNIKCGPFVPLQRCYNVTLSQSMLTPYPFLARVLYLDRNLALACMPIHEHFLFHFLTVEQAVSQVLLQWPKWPVARCGPYVQHCDCTHRCLTQELLRFFNLWTIHPIVMIFPSD